jgi:hypothetical protein
MGGIVMGDAKWILKTRARYYKIVKKIAREEQGEFTVKSIRGKVERNLFSRERWLLTSNRITGAINKLVKEGHLQISGKEIREDDRFPVNTYVWVD